MFDDFDEFELKFLSIAREHFSSICIQDEMRFFREKDLHFELGYFQNKLIYACEKAGIPAEVKGARKAGGDILVYKPNKKWVCVELKVTRHGTKDWLITRGLDRHPNVDFYLFLIWKQASESLLKALRNYFENQGYVYKIEDTNEWLLLLSKRMRLLE